MQRYIIRRVLLNIPVLLLVIVGTFALIRVARGDVITAMLQEAEGAGGATAMQREAIQQLRRELGIGDPVHIQFVKWAAGLVRGDFGRSLWTGEPTWDRFWRAAKITFELSFIALVLNILIGVPIGVLSALKQDTLADYIGRLIAIAGISIPDFWLGIMALTFPAIWWGYQAPIGYREIWVDPWGNLQQFVIPAAILGFRGAADDMRLSRSQMLEVLRQDYIRTARAKGLSERTVIFRHALRNAIIPVVTLWGGNLARILAGTVVIEQIFTLPGVGSLTLNAISLRDYTQIQTNVMILAVFVVFGNLLTDITYAFIDPRIRYN